MFVILLSLFSHVFAQSPAPLKNKSAKCNEDSGGVTSKMLDCAAEEIKSVDAELNSVYKNLLKTKSDFQKKALKKAQLAWIKFRDAECAYYADPDDGTSAAINGQGCVLELTKKRIEEIKKL